MKAVIQRVSQATVQIASEVHGHVAQGYLVLLGIEDADTIEDVEWLAKKIVDLRIFSDTDGKMNLDIRQVKGNILLVSQFTLHAKTKKGTRPSFIRAARPEQAIPLYEAMASRLSVHCGRQVETGEFGADMQVSLVNDGPVTIIIDTKDKQ